MKYEELERYLGPNPDKFIDELHKRGLTVDDVIDTLKEKEISETPKYFVVGCNINGSMTYTVDIRDNNTKEHNDIYMIATLQNGRYTDFITGTEITKRMEFDILKENKKYDEIKSISEFGLVADELIPINMETKIEMLTPLMESYKRTSYRHAFEKIRNKQGREIEIILPIVK